jgi:hypothetical protein
VTSFRHICSRHILQELNLVNVAFFFRNILQVSRGEGERSVQHTLETLVKAVISVIEQFQTQEISNILHSKVKQKDLPLVRDGAVGGGDIRGVQLEGDCKYGAGVCDDGDKAEGADDGAAGG